MNQNLQEPNTSLDVSVIIVNYNTAKIIQNCLTSLLQQQKINYEILVIDNASQDNSLEVLRNYHDQITLIANPNNSGFGPANNLAFAQSKGRYVFLLNPDAALQTEHDLYDLVQFMDKNPEYGLIGPRVTKNDRETKPQFFYPNEKHLTTTFAHLPGKIAWVIGACMLIRRTAFAAVHGFDEDYFLYGEETDLCLRLRKEGWQIGFDDQVLVKHIGGASEKSTPTPELWRKKQKGLHIFYRKHYSPADVLRAIKIDLSGARRRLCVLRVKKLFNTLTLEDLAKLARYEVVYETSRAFLQESKNL